MADVIAIVVYVNHFTIDIIVADGLATIATMADVIALWQM